MQNRDPWDDRVAEGAARSHRAAHSAGVRQGEDRPGSQGPPATSQSSDFIDELLPDVLEGRFQPGRVFDDTVGLDGAPHGYRAMNGREAIKVMLKP